MNKMPILTVDVVLFTVINDKLYVRLQERDHAPHKGDIALIGGFVDQNKHEDLTDAARDTVIRKTNYKIRNLMQVCSEGGGIRDPRGWSSTVVYLGFVDIPEADKAHDLYEVDSTGKVDANGREIAFDHQYLIFLAFNRLKELSEKTTICSFLLNKKEFTLTELRKVFEVVLNKPLNQGGFSRIMTNNKVFKLKEVGVETKTSRRPGKIYQFENPDIIYEFSVGFR